MNIIITMLISLGLILGTQTSMAYGLNQSLIHGHSLREMSAVNEAKQIISEIETSGVSDSVNIRSDRNNQQYRLNNRADNRSIESVRLEREKWFPKGQLSTYQL